MKIAWLETDSIEFPDTKNALQDPNGLLAAGGDLTPARLIRAYQSGIFPWYSENDPILWWSPNPRTIIYPNEFHISRSLKRLLKQQRYHVSSNQCFLDVIQHCANSRKGETDTWLQPEMIEAYQQLHNLGHAHSVEIWKDKTLVGGIYGVELGKLFFGESMFSLQPNTSKVAMSYLTSFLAHWKYELLDCQVYSEHLVSLGAKEIDRAQFQNHLKGCYHTYKSSWSERWENTLISW